MWNNVGSILYDLIGSCVAAIGVAALLFITIMIIMGMLMAVVWIALTVLSKIIDAIERVS